MYKRLRAILAVVLSGVLVASCIASEKGGLASLFADRSESEKPPPTLKLERCTTPVASARLTGTGQDSLMSAAYGLPSNPLPALRAIVQEGTCIAITKAAEASYTIEVAAVKVEQGNEGALITSGSMVVSMVCPFCAVGALAAPMGSKKATVTLAVLDNRTERQIAVVIGKWSGTDFGWYGGTFQKATISAGGYEETDNGKAVIAAMIDAVNQTVAVVKPPAKLP